MVMEADTVVAEEVTPVEQEAEPEAPKAEESQAEPTLEEVRAELAAEKAAREKVANQLKSAQGQLKGKLDTEAFQQATRRGLANLEARMNAIAKGQISGDPAETQRALDEAQAASQQQDAQAGFNAITKDLSQQIREDMADAGLEAGAPELAEAQGSWDEWVASRYTNLTALRQAARLTRETRRNIQTAAWEKEQADARKKSGSLSTPGIKASGTGGNVSWAQAQKIKNADDISDEALLRLMGKT